MPVVRVQFTEVEVIELPVVAGPDHPSVVVAEEDVGGDGHMDTVAGSGSKTDRKSTSSTTTVVTTPRYTDSSSIALGWIAERRTKISVNTYEERRHYEKEIRHRRHRRRFGHRFGQRRNRQTPHRQRHSRARFQLQRLSRSVRKRILRRNGIDTSDVDESEGNSNEQEGEEDPSSSVSASDEDEIDEEKGGGGDKDVQSQPKEQQKSVKSLTVDRFSSDTSMRSRSSRSSMPVDVAPRLPRRSDPSPEKRSSPQQPHHTLSTETSPQKPTGISSSSPSHNSSSMLCAEDVFSCTAPDQWFGGMLLCGSMTTTVDDIYDTLVGADQQDEGQQVSNSGRNNVIDDDENLGITDNDGDDDEEMVMDALVQKQIMSSNIHVMRSRSQQVRTNRSSRLTKKPAGYYNAGRACYTSSENRWKQ